MKNKAKISEYMGGKLHDRRLERNASIEKTASAVGVTPTVIEAIETGQEEISLPLYLKLCAYLNVSPDAYLRAPETDEFEAIKSNLIEMDKMIIKETLDL